MKTRKLLFISVLLAVLLGACGLKGPLYLPETGEPAVELETETENGEEDGSQA